jgi:hypothetical protein
MIQAVPAQETDVRSAVYYLAHAVVRCGRCLEATSVFALALPPNHEKRIGDANCAADTWECAGYGAFLSYVEYLPPDVRRLLGQLAPTYRPSGSHTGDNAYWLNHCAHCRAPQDDYFLHCEPDAAFLPTTASGAAQIQLLEVRESFAACAVGYSHELPYFDFMRMIG